MYYELSWRRMRRRRRSRGGVVFAGLDEDSVAFLECKMG